MGTAIIIGILAIIVVIAVISSVKHMKGEGGCCGGGGDTVAEEKKTLEDLFREATGDEKLIISVVALGADQLPAYIQETEEARRMNEMRKQFEKMSTGSQDDPYKDLDSMFPLTKNLVLNSDHPLVLRLRALFPE